MIRAKKCVFLSIAIAVALTAPLAGGFASAQEPAITSEVTGADPHLVAANEKMQRLAEQFNEVSGMLTQKANYECRNCQNIVKQFDADYTRLTNSYANSLSRLSTSNVEGPEFVRLADSYNNAMEQLLNKYRSRAMNARPDSLCGRCQGPAKAPTNS